MENLGIDLKLMLAQGINFLIFFFLVKKFIAKPFVSFLEEERGEEREKHILLEKAKKQDEAYALKEKEMQKKMRDELDKVVKEAKEEGIKIKNEFLAEARIEANRLKENARMEITNEKEELYRQVKEKVSDMAMLIVNKGLAESLDTDTKKKVTKKILSSLVEKGSLYEN